MPLRRFAAGSFGRPPATRSANCVAMTYPFLCLLLPPSLHSPPPRGARSAPAADRCSSAAACLIVVGYALGHEFWNAKLGPLPFTLDRVVLLGLLAAFAVQWRFGRSCNSTADRQRLDARRNARALCRKRTLQRPAGNHRRRHIEMGPAGDELSDCRPRSTESSVNLKSRGAIGRCCSRHSLRWASTSP